MNHHVLTQPPGHPQPGPPTPELSSRGFLDCRGEWQDLDDGDRDAAS